jgi:hypothetical protein
MQLQRDKLAATMAVAVVVLQMPVVVAQQAALAALA